MRKIRIRGGKHLKGSVKVPGDKVASVHILLASLILKPHTKLEITNLQLNWDTKRIVDYAVEKGLIEFKRENGSSFIQRTDKILGEDISGLAFSRASVTLTGFTLLEYDRAIFSLPGGCGFTSRPIDKHVEFLEACGGTVETDVKNDYFVATMQNKPNEVEGDCQTKWAPSVGVAVNGYLAALSGTDVKLDNVAIDAACRAIVTLLEACGASIDINHETRQATISMKSKQVLDLKITLPYDDTVAMTYVMTAVSTRSEITLEHFTPNKQLFDLLDGMGIFTTNEGDAVVIDARNPKMPSSKIVCAAYPELASDIGPMIAGGLATLTEGKTTLVDTVYDNRSSHVHDLQLMGYDVEADKNTIYVRGRKAEFETGEINALAPDIRAAATTIVAALDVNNKGANSIIMDYHQVHRGYEDLFENLVAIGCDMSEITE
jgi:UDP-N-acetylglucosamine 1-carboxyvinyltransferase